MRVAKMLNGAADQADNFSQTLGAPNGVSEGSSTCDDRLEMVIVSCETRRIVLSKYAAVTVSRDAAGLICIHNL